ncbi:MAG: hypothetical protein JSR67_14455 [Proteobacteria bacterium]|nr:hypothetical protein [Pseudomonadota bacterium]
MTVLSGTLFAPLATAGATTAHAAAKPGSASAAASQPGTTPPVVSEPGTTPSTASEPTATHDGRHDFDWDIGRWRTHQRRLLHPLTGSSTWVEYEGSDVVRRSWDGANAGTVEADGPAGHLEVFTLRLYNPQTRKWSIYFANPGVGELSLPAVGTFRDGRGDFYDREPYNGRDILVRFSVADITADSCRFEQAFSADDGKTWEVNFMVTETRLKDAPDS